MEYNITPKEIYEILKNDKEILSIYEKIEKREIEDGGWAYHNYQHVENVSKIAEKVLADLKFDEDTIYKCRIACILHDIGSLQGKEGHAQRSFEYAEKLFKDKNWLFEDTDSVLDAIKNHSSGFENDNIITLSIILADKLDIKKTRLTEAGKKVIGNRQYNHIEDVIIDIQDGVITINFITDGKIDMEEVNNYYFTFKVFKAIEAFSKKLNLKYNILLDSKTWNLCQSQ